MVTLQLSFRRKSTWLAASVLILAVGAFFACRSIDRARIASRVYRIGWQVDPPFQTRGADGQASGLAIDLVHEAARRRGPRS